MSRHSNEPEQSAPRPRTALIVALVTLSGVLTCVLIGTAVHLALGDEAAEGALARAAGITAYLLLVALVMTGFVLSHPGRARVLRPSTGTRIRIHVALAAFTFAFTALHVLVWATDDDGDVGWWGAFVPMGSNFRPIHVTLGILGLWAGVAAGLTAAFAGRGAGRVWWPIHKIAAVSLLAVWIHTLGGVDAPALLGFYVVSGLAVVALGVNRHLSSSPTDHLAHLAAVQARELPGGRRSALPTSPRPHLAASARRFRE
jgi:hypothetical protein